MNFVSVTVAGQEGGKVQVSGRQLTIKIVVWNNGVPRQVGRIHLTRINPATGKPRVILNLAVDGEWEG